MKLNDFTKAFLQLIDYLRRNFMLRLDKNYLEKKLAKRKGKCKKCGECCLGCEYLNKRTKLCKVYYSRDIPHCHKDFPLDRIDQHIWGVEKTCGYKFPR